MRCGSFPANAGSFSIGLLTCNLHYNQCLGFRSHALGNGWERSQVQVVHRRLFKTVGKIVHDGGQMFLKTSAAMLDTFVAIRERCARVTREGGPETSRSRLRQLRRKHSNPPAPNAEAVIGRLGERPALPRDEKWAENSPSAHRTRIIQNPIAEFWSSKCLRAITFFKCAPWKYSFSCGASLTNGLGFDTGAISKILLARVDEMAVSEC
jgi:hypothetical protein